MSSAVLQQNYITLDPVTHSAYVERLPTIPESLLWLQIQQDRATRSYSTDNSIATNSVYTVLEGGTPGLTHEEKIEIIKNAQSAINSNVKDIDPAIRDFVNDNFDDLLWK